MRQWPSSILQECKNNTKKVIHENIFWSSLSLSSSAVVGDVVVPNDLQSLALFEAAFAACIMKYGRCSLCVCVYFLFILSSLSHCIDTLSFATVQLVLRSLGLVVSLSFCLCLSRCVCSCILLEYFLNMLMQKGICCQPIKNRTHIDAIDWFHFQFNLTTCSRLIFRSHIHCMALVASVHAIFITAHS